MNYRAITGSSPDEQATDQEMITLADWETYADAADRLGMTADAIRHRARRLAWRRMRANDGKTLILVPDDIEPIEQSDDQAVDRASDQAMNDRPSAGSSPDRSADQTNMISALHDRIADLQAEIGRHREDRDRERAERIAERDRADRLASELADLARQFTNATNQARADHAAELAKIAEAGRTEAERAREELEGWKARSWWKRLAG